MIAVDTNILVHAKAQDLPHHRRAREVLKELTEGREPWALAWPCVYEYLRVVTHPRILKPPVPVAEALADVEGYLRSPSLVMLGEGPNHLAHCVRMILEGEARGNLAHDAHIAALLVEHGVRGILTSDRDFTRFPGLRVRNPFEYGVNEPRARYRARSARP